MLPEPPEPLTGCVGVAEPGIGNEAGSVGVKYQCKGQGNTGLTMNVSCNLPAACYTNNGDVRWDYNPCARAAEGCPPISEVNDGNIDPLTQQLHAFMFNFGAEAYDMASVTACCAEEPTPDADTRRRSCLASCAKLTCENTQGYLQYVRADTERMAELCCQFDTERCPDDFDCLGAEGAPCGPTGPMMDVCKAALDTWIANSDATAWSQYCRETDCRSGANDPSASCAGRCGEPFVDGAPCSCAPNCGAAGNCCDDVCTFCGRATDACYVGDCIRNQAAGESARFDRVTASNLDFPGTPFTFEVQLTNVFFDAGCEVDSTLPLPTAPEACGELGFGGPPSGWPEGAGFPQGLVPVGPQGSTVYLSVHDPAAAASVEADLGVPSTYDTVVEQGALAYSAPFCRSVGCQFSLDQADLLVGGLVQEFQRGGRRHRVVLTDGRLTFNGRAVGTITAVHPDQTLEFEIPAAAMHAQTRGTAAHQRRNASGTWETVNTWEGQQLPVVTATPTTGRVLPDGRIEIDEAVFDAADFRMVLSVQSGPPLNTAPVADVQIEALPCGGVRALATGTTDAQDPFDTLEFQWFRDGTPVGTGPELLLPMGPFNAGRHDLFLQVRDTGGMTDAVMRTVVVRGDTEGPQVTFGPDEQQIELRTCVPDFDTYVVPAPTVTDTCVPAQDITVVALLTSVNGQVPPSPVVPWDAAGAQVSLPPGNHEITWRAFDGHGNTTEVVQQIHVRLVQPMPTGGLAGGSAECCDPGQQIVLGSNASDELVGTPGTDYCVFAFGADDDLSYTSGDDRLFAGSGDDVVVAGDGRDLLYGAGGADALFATSALGITTGPGDAGTCEGNRLYGGSGADTLQGGICSDRLLGGAGADVLAGSAGADVLIPGPGRDIVNAGHGDDTVYIYDECELAGVEIIFCGPGQDTLFAPVSGLTFSLEDGIELHYLALGCEQVIITEQLRFRSECYFAQNPGDIVAGP